jgi:hypothetical protein
LSFATFNYEKKSTHALIAGIRFDNRKIEMKTHGEVGEEGHFEVYQTKKFQSFNAALGYKTE